MHKFDLIPKTTIALVSTVFTSSIVGLLLLQSLSTSNNPVVLGALSTIIVVNSIAIMGALLSNLQHFKRVVLAPLYQLNHAIEKNLSANELKKATKNAHPHLRSFAKLLYKLKKDNTNHPRLKDKLTGLPSRTLFNENIKAAVKECKRNNKSLALLCLDLNRFKEINESLGHEVGDRILVDVSNRLKNLLREMDSIARLGDDEFAIMLKGTDLKDAETVANKIAINFSMPFLIDNHQLLISPSIGTAVYPDHAKEANELLSKANSAMNIAKSDHITHLVFDEERASKQAVDPSLSSELRDALNQDQLQLFYQPKFSLSENRVVEAEALLRWIHPEKGFIPPDKIVHVAESSGLIHPLTEWVVRTAVKQQKAWEKENIDIGVAVNLSVYNLQNPHLISIIQFLLLESETKENKLILEITEGAMMSNPELAKEILSNLDKMNIKIAIDDFGTGYSSLAYLKNLPVDELKIDRSFVMNLKDDANDLAIVRATIDLAHNLNLSVVAEGVENQESWDILQELGCDLIQGFYLSKPQPVADFENWYHKHSGQKLRLA